MEVTNNQTSFAGSSEVSFDDGIVFSAWVCRYLASRWRG